MNFALVFAYLLVALASADPEPQFRSFRRAVRPSVYSYWPYNRHARTVYDHRTGPTNGFFSYDFLTENGIQANQVGRPGVRGQSNVVGSYSYPHPDGGVAEVRYVADEFGYRAESPLIPKPPPLPAHAIEQIRTAAEQRARGIRWY
ncbi:hypothetical protein SK128_018550 [Halocaridina rubra]|uniref:Cuticle protein 7 n=1 Tax=Halocaridina rubra TaxID=373956 RepID=A0AAN8X9X6_HALRR